MAHQNVYEEKNVTASVERTEGKTENQEVEFTFLKETADGEEVLETKTEQLKKSAGEGAEDAGEEGQAVAEVKWQPPAVDPRAKSYDVTVKHKLDDFTFERYLKVWPQKGKLTVVDEQEKALKGFQFKISQGRRTTEHKMTEDPSVKDFSLVLGKEFKVEAIPPFEILETLETGHEVKVKGKLSFEAEFVDLDNAAAGTIRQYVNEDTAGPRAGRDNKGHEVTLRIGVNGDRDKEEAKRVGQAGVFAFFQVEFGAEVGDRSKRNAPVAEIKDGLNLTEKNPDGDNKFKGKVELAGPENTGEFKIDLGIAGGDNCTVKIGGTDACADATVKLVNWRKLFYEFIYPSCLEGQLLRAQPATADDAGMDIPAAIKTSIDEKLGGACIEYARYRSHAFTKVQAEAVCKTWTTAGFLKHTTAPAAEERYYTNYFIADKMADEGLPIAFDGNANTRLMRLMMVHKYFKRNGSHNYDENHETNPIELDAPASRYLTPMDCGKVAQGGGADSIDFTDAHNKWEAVVPAGHGKPVIAVNPVSGGSTEGSSTRMILIAESNLGMQHVVTFTKSGIGHIRSDLSEEAKQGIRDYLGRFADVDAIRAHGCRLTFTVTGPTGNARQNDRMTAIEDFLNNESAGLLPYVHPAVNADGTPRSGPLTRAMVKYEVCDKLKVDLPAADPTDPGSWIGPIGPDQAPVRIRLDTGLSSGINGNVYKEHQNVVLIPGANAGSAAGTFCHELGHAMGLTILPGRNKKPPGTDDAKHLDDPNRGTGLYYRNGTPDFTKGIRNKHVGGHCAHGLTGPQKSSGTLSGGTGSCIMWGAGVANNGRPSYCPTCTLYLKARKLADIRMSWTARPDAEC